MRVRRRCRGVGSWYEGCRWLLLLYWRLIAVCPLLLLLPWIPELLWRCLLVSWLLRLLVSWLLRQWGRLVGRLPGVARRLGGLVPLLLEL